MGPRVLSFILLSIRVNICLILHPTERWRIDRFYYIKNRSISVIIIGGEDVRLRCS